MSRFRSAVIALCIILGPVYSFAVDGTVLINQATVIAAGGFPYNITQPGSYKLSSNLIVPANTDGIDILVSHVTLDLNGFNVIGPILCNSGNNCSPAAGGDVHGILGRPGNITIRNGGVQGFRRGIFVINGVVEDIHASDNFQIGIIASFSVLRRNTATGNGAIGIAAQACVVTENIADLNPGAGFDLSGGGVFGSNVLVSPPGSSLTITSDVVSQHNNSCTDSSGITNPC